MYEVKKEINSINEYINFIYEYRLKNREELWFRGHRDNNWILDSTLNREKIMDIPPHRTGEVDALKYKNILDFEEEMNRFKQQMGECIPKNFNKFHLMFLGQHYGLKTPALDWTTDPLVALCFALDQYEKQRDIYPVIFVLKPEKLNANSRIVYTGGGQITEPIVIDDLSDELFDEWLSNPNNTPFTPVPLAVKSNLDISYRIARQSGVFTLMDTCYPLNYSWINTMINGEPFGIVIKINPDAVESIQSYLAALNITKSTMYGNAHNEWDELCEKVVLSTPVI